ncbi:MAG TPA: Smr/MutS family protein [Polyangia bacterium]|jgi:DNA-nicking Smr family endonuclease
MPRGDDEETRAFAEAMRDARKLEGPGRVPVTRAPGPAPRRAPAPASTRATESATTLLVVEEVGELWSARASGIDRRFARKLAAGKVEVEARVDLHGRTRAESARTLERFLAAARAAGRRCLLVIHGRGLHSGHDGPALREAVRRELTEGAQAAHVLACASAPPTLGGGGATLIWLRR